MGQAEQDCQDRTSRTGIPAQDCHHRADKIRQPGQDKKERTAEKDSQIKRRQLDAIAKKIITVSPTSCQVQKIWFRLSRLRTIMAIGLWKPYAKSESGTNIVIFDVY
jgi:hypothetical protein